MANVGASVTPNNGWIDNYYLSSTTNFNVNTGILIGSLTRYASLAPGQSYTNVLSLTTPNGLAGIYYLFVDADADGRVFELDKTNNIGGALSPITSTAPLPKLVPTSLSVPSPLTPGNGTTISYSVQNQGSIDTVASYWNDTLYLSADPNGANPISLGAFPHFGLLNPGESYSVTNQFVGIPYGLSFGTYYVFLQADRDQLVYLGSNSVNRTSAPHPVSVFASTADLSVSLLTAPTNTVAGNLITVKGGDESRAGPDVCELLSTIRCISRPIHAGNSRAREQFVARKDVYEYLEHAVADQLGGELRLHVIAGFHVASGGDTIRSNNVVFDTNALQIQAAPPSFCRIWRCCK